jgi:AbrB family looped-hinge helix DNA binding protein
MRVKVSKKYQIAVPSEVRKQLRIDAGDTLLVDVQGDHIVLIPEPKDYVKYMKGLHREVWQDVEPQEYVRRERDAWQAP